MRVSHDLDVPTMLTPNLNDLLCFYSMCGVEKVSDLINHPVVCLFGTRVVYYESIKRELKISETRLTNEKFANVMGEYVT
jgi:hypothetical protein